MNDFMHNYYNLLMSVLYIKSLFNFSLQNNLIYNYRWVYSISTLISTFPIRPEPSPIWIIVWAILETNA
jgi:hypothetical protein